MHESGADKIDISIVVPAYHGEDTIAGCLQSIYRCTGGRRTEIIVVDSSASTATADVVSRFPQVILIRSNKRLSAGAARNRGCEAAQGRLILFTDQDCIVPADWIDRFERHAQDPAIAAAGGAVGIQDPWNLSGCAVYFLEFLTHFPRQTRRLVQRKFLIGCNCCVRAEVFKVVRFPAQTLGEDILFSHELRERGFRIVHDPEIVVLHRNRTGWKSFFAYNFKMGRAAANYHSVVRLWWAQPALRWPWLAFFSPILVLPSIFLGLLGSPLSYVFRFFLLSPMCLIGNLVWARGFRREVLERRLKAVDLAPSDPALHVKPASVPRNEHAGRLHDAQ